MVSNAAFRITPAWAGKRTCRSQMVVLRRDYPRVGGEESSGEPVAKISLGLPPRGRGRDYLLPTLGAPERITPAWAGKRRPARVSIASLRDYPRVGGEELAEVAAASTRSGLPPRGRGRAAPRR